MPHSSYMYHVIRHTDDQHHGGEQTEIQGTYWTLEEANDAARADLTNEWERDFFEEYTEEEQEDGSVTIQAHCPEGEVMSVYIERKPAPLQPSAPKARPSDEGSAEQFGLDVIWILMVTTTAHHEDEEGQTDIGSSIAYESISQANSAARDVLIETCGVDDEADIEELQESNRGSSSQPYSATAYILTDDTYSVKVEVRKIEIQRDSGRKRVAAHGAAGRRKRPRVNPEDVVVISD